MDLAEAKKQCQRFIAEMADNRAPKYDDAGMARAAICVAIYGRILPRED